VRVKLIERKSWTPLRLAVLAAAFIGISFWLGALIELQMSSQRYDGASHMPEVRSHSLTTAL